MRNKMEFQRGDKVVVIKDYDCVSKGMVGVVVGFRNFSWTEEEYVICRFPGWTKGHRGKKYDENGKPYDGNEMYYLPKSYLSKCLT